jgi:hypothetical protein
MKTLLNASDREEILNRASVLKPDSPRRWGKMTASQMICHLSDSFRSAFGEKYASSSANWFKRSIYKWIALNMPFKWPQGVKTRPEMDQQLGGTKPLEFAKDVAEFRALVERFCTTENNFAPHPMFGQMTRAERMRWAYLHIDHHFRQFGV